jgi:hypothetical protein
MDCSEGHATEERDEIDEAVRHELVRRGKGEGSCHERQDAAGKAERNDDGPGKGHNDHVRDDAGKGYLMKIVGDERACHERCGKGDDEKQEGAVPETLDPGPGRKGKSVPKVHDKGDAQDR